jgi:hypothetical protein
MQVNIDDWFCSGLESVGVLSTPAGSSDIDVHFHERPSENVLKNFDVSGKQPVLFMKQSDDSGIQLNASTSTIVLDGVTYRFGKRIIVNKYVYLFELNK